MLLEKLERLPSVTGLASLSEADNTVLANLLGDYETKREDLSAFKRHLGIFDITGESELVKSVGAHLDEEHARNVGYVVAMFSRYLKDTYHYAFDHVSFLNKSKPKHVDRKLITCWLETELGTYGILEFLRHKTIADVRECIRRNCVYRDFRKSTYEVMVTRQRDMIQFHDMADVEKTYSYIYNGDKTFNPLLRALSVYETGIPSLEPFRQINQQKIEFENSYPVELEKIISLEISKGGTVKVLFENKLAATEFMEMVDPFSVIESR